MDNNSIMNNDIQYKIPLGLCKQAVMKLDSFRSDIYEIKEDPDLDPEDIAMFEQILAYANDMMTAICNIVSKEMGEEEFLNEQIDMDEIESYPGDEEDILEQSVE